MLQINSKRLLLAFVVTAFTFVDGARAQQRILSDYFVRPAQAGIPNGYGNPGYGNPGYGNPGVALQGIQPFDPYANAAPSLPPPLSGGSYSPAYPAPPPNLSAPPVIPPAGYGVPAASRPTSVYGAGPYQPAYNFNGGGFYGGFHAPILQARYGNINVTSSAFNPNQPNDVVSINVNASPQHNLAFSTRIIGGYEGPEGLGFRVKWWHFDDTADGTLNIQLVTLAQSYTLQSSTSSQIATDVFDLELTQAGRFHNWELLVSGGVRFADIGNNIQSTFNLPNLPNGSNRFFRTTSGFDGVGPVLGVSSRRALGQWEGLAFTFDSRFGFLFGDQTIEHSSNLANGAVTREEVAVIQDVLPTWELQIGALWTRKIQSGSTFYIGAFFEAQLWDWIAPGQFNSDLGFWGPTFAVGISQ